MPIGASKRTRTTDGNQAAPKRALTATGPVAANPMSSGKRDEGHQLDEFTVAAAQSSVVVLAPGEHRKGDAREHRAELVHRHDHKLEGDRVQTQRGGAEKAPDEQVVDVRRPVVDAALAHLVRAKADVSLEVGEADMETRPPAAPAVRGKQRRLGGGRGELGPDQRVHALVRDARGHGDCQTDQRRRDLDQAEALEEKVLLQQHLELLSDRRDQEEQACPEHRPAQSRLVEEGGDERRTGGDGKEDDEAHDQVHPVQCRELVARRILTVDDGAAEAHVGVDLGEADDGHDHRHETEIGA